MYGEIIHTNYHEEPNPVLIWDGECGFCKYWVIKLGHKTRGKIDYKPYQDVALYYKDIPINYFKKASRLIEPDGTIFSGPDSFYRSLHYTAYRDLKLHRLYSNASWFKRISDIGYKFIAQNRSFLFKVSKILFGPNPESSRPYWLLYLLIIFVSSILLYSI